MDAHSANGHRCSHCIVIGRIDDRKGVGGLEGYEGNVGLRGDGNRRGSDGERADGGGDLVVNTVDDHDRTRRTRAGYEDGMRCGIEGHGLRGESGGKGSQHSSGFGIQHDDLVTGGIGDVEMAEDRIGNDRSRGSADVPGQGGGSALNGADGPVA